MDYSQKNAIILAEWLEKQPSVTKVYFPGIKSNEGYKTHLSQADGPGAVLSFETTTSEKAKAFMKKLTTAALAVSLGGVETIVSYPVKTSHVEMQEEDRLKIGITDRLMRVSVGLEDIEDLLEDFKQALA